MSVGRPLDIPWRFLVPRTLTLGSLPRRVLRSLLDEFAGVVVPVVQAQRAVFLLVDEPRFYKGVCERLGVSIPLRGDGHHVSLDVTVYTSVVYAPPPQTHQVADELVTVHLQDMRRT